MKPVPMTSYASLLVAVSGMMASGKTSLIDLLQEQFQAVGYQVQVFHETFDPKLLSRFYDDPAQWAFALQMDMLQRTIQRYEAARLILSAKPNTIVLIDGTLQSNRVYADMHRRNGLICAEQMATYDEQVSSSIDLAPDMELLSDITAEEALERILKRHRSCELEIPIEYLKHLRDDFVEYGARLICQEQVTFHDSQAKTWHCKVLRRLSVE
jgi:deoxyadenosine/deoxycytidine kinase